MIIIPIIIVINKDINPLKRYKNIFLSCLKNLLICTNVKKTQRNKSNIIEKIDIIFGMYKANNVNIKLIIISPKAENIISHKKYLEPKKRSFLRSSYFS